MARTLIYSANRIPEISDDIINIDNAMKWGFGWEYGPFESWDILGVKESSDRMIADGKKVPDWVLRMLSK
jgi:3-hydroxyacyl-CoA dehydrogenase